MRLLRAADRAAIPWKNGGGVTRDVIVSPAGATLDTFDWRISIAEIAGDGPFSRFSGIDRTLAVLDGKVALTVDGHAPVTLNPHSAPLDFPGEAVVEGRLVDGPSMDLNIMTRRGRFSARMAMQSAAQPAMAASVAVILALNGLTVRIAGETVRMERLDALLFDHPSTPTIAPKGAAYCLIEISSRS